MKHKIFFFLLVTILVLSNSAPAYAQDFSLSVAPPVITIQTSAPKLIKKPLTITNNTNTPMDLEIVFQPFTQADSNRGVVSYGVDNDTFFHIDKNIFEKIQIYDGETPIDTVSLAPKQQKKLILHITLPEKEKNGDYYFSILFTPIQSGFASNNYPVIASETKQSSKEIATSLTAPRNDKSGSNDIEARSSITPSIGINVLLSIYTGKKTPEGIIDNYSAPLFVSSGPVSFDLVFKNTGLYLLIPQGTILIRNMFGQAVGKVAIPPTNVLSLTSRILPATWNEQFLLGPYTAELHLTGSDNINQSFTRSIVFFAAPTQEVYSIIGLIIVLLIIKGRLNKYRK